ncbi:MAG: helix-turn-helix transcriptional regulator [Bacteroidales bacterium]|nr:helix-turn-helix transcriptional regulator [Bacteroidales bacterium]
MKMLPANCRIFTIPFEKMTEAWHLILLIIPLLAGAISIFFSFRLMKRYKLPFTVSFFYYLVFLYIFGTYGLAGSGILEHLLGRMEIDQKIIHSASLYAIFLGIPFLALAKFMFLRSILEFLNKKLSNPFVFFYFLILASAFISYGVYMVRLTRFDLGEYQRLIQFQRWAFAAFMLLIYLLAYAQIYKGTRKSGNFPAKKHLRVFGSWYLAYTVLCVAPLSLTTYHPIFRQFFFLIFLSWHLIPILFLNIYLNKFHNMEHELPGDFETRLQAFVGKHEISKRECEVVRLICSGLSNQEISETLFISLQTVKDHIHRIFVKTGVKNRVQLSNMIR